MVTVARETPQGDLDDYFVVLGKNVQGWQTNCGTFSGQECSTATRHAHPDLYQNYKVLYQQEVRRWIFSWLRWSRKRLLCSLGESCVRTIVARSPDPSACSAIGHILYQNWFSRYQQNVRMQRSCTSVTQFLQGTYSLFTVILEWVIVLELLHEPSLRDLGVYFPAWRVSDLSHGVE